MKHLKASLLILTGFILATSAQAMDEDLFTRNGGEASSSITAAASAAADAMGEDSYGHGEPSSSSVITKSMMDDCFNDSTGRSLKEVGVRGEIYLRQDFTQLFSFSRPARNLGLLGYDRALVSDDGRCIGDTFAEIFRIGSKFYPEEFERIEYAAILASEENHPIRELHKILPRHEVERVVLNAIEFVGNFLNEDPSHLLPSLVCSYVDQLLFIEHERGTREFIDIINSPEYKRKLETAKNLLIRSQTHISTWKPFHCSYYVDQYSFLLQRTLYSHFLQPFIKDDFAQRQFILYCENLVKMRNEKTDNMNKILRLRFDRRRGKFINDPIVSIAIETNPDVLLLPGIPVEFIRSFEDNDG